MGLFFRRSHQFIFSIIGYDPSCEAFVLIFVSRYFAGYYEFSFYSWCPLLHLCNLPWIYSTAPGKKDNFNSYISCSAYPRPVFHLYTIKSSDYKLDGTCHNKI
ncbi:hypothetical protein RF11_08669 [Thelohanellus kitauei]|uniref:Uncharacterized protein n=1 Tax=Thelohanellus kitauei TaxID=669202 RepID=A0A0C2N7E4_THEKT|nr:hypothetical protein RF11_08669 [Thelohanellus kitauei]